MFNCKYCNAGVEENSSFCGNCGNLATKDNDNIVVSTLKMVGKGLGNPAAYMRNAKSANIISTGILFGAIMLITILELLIFSKGATGQLLSLSGFNTWSLVVSQVFTLAITIGVMFLILTVTHQKANIIECINIVVFANLFICLFGIVAILLSFITATLAGLVLGISVVMYYSMLYKGLNEGLDVDIKTSCITLIACLVGTGLLVNIISRIF